MTDFKINYLCATRPGTICPSDPFYVVTYYKKWVTTSCTHSSDSWQTTQRTYIEHVDEVDVVPVQHLTDEVDELLRVTLVRLQPGRVEVQAERSPGIKNIRLKILQRHIHMYTIQYKQTLYLH